MTNQLREAVDKWVRGEITDDEMYEAYNRQQEHESLLVRRIKHTKIFPLPICRKFYSREKKDEDK